MKHSLRIGLASLAAFFDLALGRPAFAQLPDPAPPPVHSMVDERGVDLLSGDVNIEDEAKVSIGTPENGISYKRFMSGPGGWRHNYVISLAADTGHVDISIGQSRVGFRLSGGVYQPDYANGATLTEAQNTFTYTASDGTVILFDKVGANGEVVSYFSATTAIAKTITSPSGLKTYLHYSTFYYEVDNGLEVTPMIAVRLQSVRTSTGFQLKYVYSNNTPTGYVSSSQDWKNLGDWYNVTNVAAINAAYDYCNPDVDVCGSLTQIWPTINYSSNEAYSPSDGVWTKTETSTDPAGRTSSYITKNNGTFSVRRPSSPSANTTEYWYGSNDKVWFVGQAGIDAYTYEFIPGSGTLTAKVQAHTPTIPSSAVRTVVSRTDLVAPTSDTNENGQTTWFAYCDGTVTGCPNGLRDTVTQPENNKVTYRYDPRGNVTSTVWTPKPGSPAGTLTTYVAYPGSCGGSVTPAMCNKPTSTTDTAGAVTNYYYNSNGTLDYVQLPSPGGSAPRPETHYTYWTGQAWLKWYSTSVSLAPDPVTLLSTTTTCITGAWPCATSAQRKVTLNYAGGPSATNMQVNGVVQSRGDGADYSATSFTSDNVGNIVSVTDPLGKTSNMAYNGVRQLVWQRSPSVDGTSTGQKRQTTYEFDADGNVNKLGVGTVNWDGSGFSPTQYVFTGYDVLGRKQTQWQVNGAQNAILAATQWYYNGAGRLECEIVRMNSALFYRGPATDCSGDTPGSYGPDRVTRYQYFPAGQIDNVQTGYGVSAKTQAAYVYTPNGKVSTMSDGKGNQTTYAYDGHDRQLRECYNTALGNCQAGTASDFVQLTYDNVGHLTNRSLRGHPLSITIGYGYDGLGRLTNANYPGGSTFDAPVTYSYDNLGQLVNAIDTNGILASFGYDALGRVTSQGSWLANRTMQYDAAGRRTRLTWSDGRYVTYEYNATGDMTAIRENGSSPLASFGYDGVGRRTSLTRGNGVTTYYDYDAISRLACLRNDLAGGSTLACSSSSVTASGQDQATNFAYNPASQIVSRTAANDAYAWQGHYNYNYNYTTNGLNQYTAVGPFNPSYDVKGNFASTGVGQSFSTSTKNEMVQRTDTGVSFYHDPLHRLVGVWASSNYGFEYVDDQISEERLGSGWFPITRRYVYGPNADEPIVWYEGSDFSDKRYLVADERGSITAVTSSSGAATNINSYDEHGIPRSSNAGRFQYTGQAWLSELGMYSYKARVYTPTLGRFAQTDPAGYPDGPNWYNYVNADPVNKTDPSGLSGQACVVDGTGTYCGPGGGGGPGYQPSGAFSIFNVLARLAWIGTYSPPEPPKPTPPQSGSNCSAGTKAANMSKAIGYAGNAHDAFKGLADAGGGGSPFKVASRALNAVNAVSNFTSSIQRGEPLDVAYMRATSPLLTATLGGIAGAAGGATTMGLAGSVVPVLGSAGGIAVGTYVGGVAGGAAGGILGDLSAEAYARQRGYGGC